jgi:CP family cyanate transporter-like MFS transporter
MPVRASVPVAVAIAGLILIATTMRGPFTAVGPLLDTIRSDLHLSGAGAGALGMLPLLAFAGISPVAPVIARRIGLERSLVVALAVHTAGLVLRALPGVVALFAGTAFIGVAIGMVNVLLLALIKRDNPARAAALTGLYTTTMGTFAMLGSGLAVPVANAAPGGWRTSLGVWAILAMIALVVWLPRLRSPVADASIVDTPVVSHWRSPLAWQLTTFMGLQSFGFYVAISWLPTILHSHGVSVTAAGWYLALMQLSGLIASAVCAPLIGRLPDQRLLGALASGLGMLSYLGFVVAPGLGILWSATVGFSQGVCITLALSLFALRAKDARQAAALSGMGQSLGYLLAALGPLLFGVLHDATGSWTPPLLILVALITLQSAVALGAGRNRYIGEEP